MHHQLLKGICADGRVQALKEIRWVKERGREREMIDRETERRGVERDRESKRERAVYS